MANEVKVLSVGITKHESVRYKNCWVMLSNGSIRSFIPVGGIDSSIIDTDLEKELSERFDELYLVAQDKAYGFEELPIEIRHNLLQSAVAKTDDDLIGLTGK